MKSLDDPGAYQELDRSDMLGRIEELPQQCLRAWDNAMSLDLPSHYPRRVQGVVILGMGVTVAVILMAIYLPMFQMGSGPR